MWALIKNFLKIKLSQEIINNGEHEINKIKCGRLMKVET